MRIRKSLCLLAVMVLAVTAWACAGAESVPVGDDNAFEQMLGISFRGSSLNNGNVSMRVVNGLFGETAYVCDGVQWVVRFTRNPDYTSAASLTGIPESEMSGALDLVNGLKMRSALFRGVDIYTWKIGGTFYCMTVSGPYGNAQLNEQLNSAMNAGR